jgi:small GTP-binding protein
MTEGEPPRPEAIQKYRLIVCGRTHTGKTSIIRQYVDHHFITNFFPTPLPVVEGTMHRDEFGPYEVSIWDTAGAKEWASMNASIYHGAQIIVYVASYDEPQSIPELFTDWVPQLSEHLKLDDCVQILAINKCDLRGTAEATVSDSDISEAHVQLHVELFDVSAKDDLNIGPMFEFAAKAARKKFPPASLPAKPIAAPVKQEKGCC